MNWNKVCNVEDWPQLVELVPEASRAGGYLRRKDWEIWMALGALADLPDGAEVLGVGAGAEATIFHLVNRGHMVHATDLYASPGAWGTFAPVRMLTEPERLSPVVFDKRRLVVQHMDMRDLRYPDERFDAVFSSGSIEHVGGFEDIARAAAEIGRVLKPGGIATLATEFKLNDTEGHGWPGVVVFDESTLRRHIVQAARLDLVSEPDFGVNEATLATEYPLREFVEAHNRGLTVAHDDVAQSHDGYVYTSVQLTLRKPSASSSTKRSRKKAS